MVDASAIGVGTVLIQTEDNEQTQVTSWTSRIFNESKRKIDIIFCEKAATLFALKIYELSRIGSKHPITIFTDHEPILNPFAREGNINPRFIQ